MSETSFSEHTKKIIRDARLILDERGYDAIIFHAGTPRTYHADDQHIPFRAVPHFVRFIPTTSPHHLLFIDRTRALFIEVVPKDYWEEQEEKEPFWKSAYETLTVDTPEAAWKGLPDAREKKIAFVGDEPASSVARTNGIQKEHCNPEVLIEALNDARAVKTPYEILCIQKANERAAKGHRAARDAFFEGKSEREIHYAYLSGAGAIENELPYPTIVALNEKSATLHYQHKRADVPSGNVLLIDAGAKENGYASDITRTHSAPSCNPRFISLLSAVEELQKKLVGMVRPGVHFIELHHEAHLGIASLLKSHEIILEEGEGAIQHGITRTFFPHGLGHLLGIQVHDVGGISKEVGAHPLQKLYPNIRTNRQLDAGYVTTIEPGIYFNEVLLAPHRTGETKKLFNWKLIDELKPLGGIRIEDNILVTQKGPQNLTRPYLP